MYNKFQTRNDISRRSMLLGTGAALTALGLSACGGNPDSLASKPAAGGGGGGQLVVYDGGGPWGEAQRKAYFLPFEKETGIKVIPASAPPAAQLKTAIEAGQPGMDVIDMNGARVGTWASLGLLEKIDYTQWKDQGLKDKFDPYPALEFATPAIVYAVQLAYDKDVIGKDLNSWADLWDTRTFPGKRSFYPASGPSGSTLEIALLADGVDPKNLYPLDMDRAYKKLTELRPDILKFWSSGAESVQLLVDKQITGVAAWNGRIQTAISDGAEGIGTTFNQAIIQADYWGIPKGSKNIEGATAFIEFASRPENQAKFSELITYAPTVPEAYNLIPKDRQRLLVTAPGVGDRAIVQDVNYWSSKGPDGKTMEETAGVRWQEWLSS